MPAREPLKGADPCELSHRWAVSLDVMRRLVLSADDMWNETRRDVLIISGARTRAEQARLGRTGRPAAPDNLSTHRSCPATGVDVSMGFGIVITEKHIWERILFLNGLRMGGGSRRDEYGIPSDWNHVDDGPRQT